MTKNKSANPRFSDWTTEHRRSKPQQRIREALIDYIPHLNEFISTRGMRLIDLVDESFFHLPYEEDSERDAYILNLGFANIPQPENISALIDSAAWLSSYAFSHDPKVKEKYVPINVEDTIGDLQRVVNHMGERLKTLELQLSNRQLQNSFCQDDLISATKMVKSELGQREDVSEIYRKVLDNSEIEFTVVIEADTYHDELMDRLLDIEFNILEKHPKSYISFNYFPRAAAPSMYGAERVWYS